MRNEIPWKEYCSLRPADLKKPEYRHLWWLLYWPAELSFFTLAGRLPWHYHPVYSPLDDAIPFSEIWVIPYCLWFLCAVFTVFYTVSRDIRVFRRFTDYMIVTILLAGAVYLIWPNYFPGRPVEALGWPGTVAAYYEAMPRKNLCLLRNLAGNFLDGCFQFLRITARPDRRAYAIAHDSVARKQNLQFVEPVADTSRRMSWRENYLCNDVPTGNLPDSTERPKPFLIGKADKWDA